MKKSAWSSKTFWVNLVASLAAVATMLGLDLGLSEAAQAEIVLVIMGVVNLILRFVTKEPIKL